MKKSIYEKIVKRVLDFLGALFFLILFSWLYLILAVMVRIKLGTPVLFAQERPGKDGKLFRLYKFRSMTDERDSDGNLLSDEERLPEFGKKLRSTSLDELPEMINILKGEMSFVGPRPLLVKYLPLYNEHQARRHEVRPGITGLAQIHGRNAISWQEKFEWDVKYVDSVSFVFDLRILIQTAKVVLHKEGVTSENSVTTEEFTGNP